MDASYSASRMGQVYIGGWHHHRWQSAAQRHTLHLSNRNSVVRLEMVKFPESLYAAET